VSHYPPLASLGNIRTWKDLLWLCRVAVPRACPLHASGRNTRARACFRDSNLLPSSKKVYHHSSHQLQKRPPASPRSLPALLCSFQNPLLRSCQLPHLLFSQSQVPCQGVARLTLRVRVLIPGGLILPSMARAGILSICFRRPDTPTHSHTGRIR